MKDKILKSNLFWIICIILLWELVSITGLVSSYILPPFSKVVLQIVEELKDKTIIQQVLNSFRVVLVGLTISTIVSLVALILSDKFKYFEYFIRTICNILSPLPSVAILPLVIIWMGVNDNAMLVLVVHSIVWPMIINLLERVKSIPNVYHDFLSNIEMRQYKKSIICICYANIAWINCFIKNWMCKSMEINY